MPSPSKQFAVQKFLAVGLCILTFLIVLYYAIAPGFAEVIAPSAPQGYVLDEAQILSPETIQSLETTLGALDKETSTQMVVVTVPSLQGYEPEQFALAIGRTWGVGQDEHNNGLVFLIAPTEQAVRIEVGYGLEGAIPDATAWQIIDNIALPAFKTGDYNTGTLESINALQTIARGEPFTVPEATDTGSWADFAEVGFILVMVVINFLASSKSWWLGGIIGGVIGIIIFQSVMWLIICAFIGLILDFILSKYLHTHFSSGGFFGGRSGGGGGGFGGFGGGGFGGGGASGRW